MNQPGFASRFGAIVSTAAFAALLLAVNDDGACGRGSNEGQSDTSGGDTTEPPACQIPADCEDSGAPRLGCDGHWTCNEGQCGWECDRPEPVGCYGDGDCQDGYRCNASDVCLPPPGCEPGEPCPDVCWGQCVAIDPCFSNDECGDGRFCDFSACGVTPNGLVACAGTCQPLAGCTTAADCDEGELCACVPPGFSMPSALVACELQCVPRDAQCLNDGECKEGYVCRDFICEQRTAGCWSEADCPLGWTCEPDCGTSSSDAERPIACPSTCQPPEGGGTCGEGGPVCREGEHCEETCWIDVPDCGCTPDESGDCACPGQLVCAATCVPDNGWGECASDSDCPLNHYCGCNPDAAGVCQPACLPVDVPYNCTSDAECADGFCRIQVCTTEEGRCDPNGQCEPPQTICYGYCEPHYDCTQDADCGPDGHCKIDWEMCGQAPSASDEDRMMPPPLCQGWCRYPDPLPCGPDGLTCNEGETCQETWDCGGGSDSRRPCFATYACVPSEGSCRSDADCAAPNICQNGICEALYCWDGRCPEGYACQSDCGTMEPLPNGLIMCPMVCLPEAATCADDCDCNINEACINGTCHEITGPNECRWIGCRDDSECARTEQCLVMCPLCLPDMPCPPCQGECAPRASCYADTDCSPDEYCDFEAPAATDTCDCTDCSCEAQRPARQGICALRTP